VLEVGTGTGYMAALLAHRAQHVTTLEIVPADGPARPRQPAPRRRSPTSTVRQADGSRGLPAEAPFDVIVLSGSVAEVPPTLLSLLAPGGRLAAIVGHEPVMRATIITRTGDAAFQTAQPWDTVAPRLQNFPAPSRFRF